MRFTANTGLRYDGSAPLLIPVLVLLALPRPVLPFSRGASGSSCTSMVPGHVHAHPHDPALSHVTLHASSARYLPGHLVTVTVRSSRDFMGFLLQARRAERPQSQGGMGAVLVGGAWTLTPPGTHTIRCISDGDTVTHSDKQLKRNLSFVWRAPDRPVGDVRFYMTVVQSYFVYWTGIRSPVLHDGTRGRWRGSFHSMLQVQTSDEDSDASGVTQTPQTTILKTRLATTLLKNEKNMNETSGISVTEGFEAQEMSKQPETSSLSHAHKPGFGQSVSKEQSFPGNLAKTVGTSEDMLESATESPQISLHTSQSWIETDHSTNGAPQTKQVHQEESTTRSTKFAPFKRLKDLLLHLDSLFEDDKTTFPPFVANPTKSITTKTISSTYPTPTSSVQGKHMTRTTLNDSSDIATISSGTKMTTISKSSTSNPINTMLNHVLASGSQHETLGELKETLLQTSKSTQMTNSDRNTVITSTSTSPTSKTQNLASMYTISRGFSTIFPTDFNQKATNSMAGASRPSTPQTLFHGSKFRDKATVFKGSTIAQTTAQNTASYGSTHSFKLITEGPTSNTFDSTSMHLPSTTLQDGSPMQNASTIPSIVFASTSRSKSGAGQSLNTVSTDFHNESAKFTMNVLAKLTNSTTFGSDSSHRSSTTLQETTKRPSFTSTFSHTNGYNAATISEYITPTSLLIDQNPTSRQKSISEREMASETNSLTNDAITNEQPRSTTLSNDTTAHSGQQSSQFSSVLASTLDQKATTVSKDAKITFQNPILHDYSNNFPFYSRIEPRDSSTVPTLSKEYTSTTLSDDLDHISKSFPGDFSQSKASTIARSSSTANTESSRQTTFDNSLHNIVHTSESAKVFNRKSDFQQKESTLVSEVSRQSGPLSNNSPVDLQHWPTFEVSVEASTTQLSFEHVSSLEPKSTSRVQTRSRANSNTASQWYVKLATTFQDTSLAPTYHVSPIKGHGSTLDDTTFLQQNSLTIAKTAKTIDSTSQSEDSESSAVSSPAYTSTKGSHSSNFNDTFAISVEDTVITSDSDSTVTTFSKSPLETNSSAIVGTNFIHSTSQEGSVIPSSMSLREELKQAPKGITIGPEMQHYSPTNGAKNSWQNSSLEHANTSSTMTIPSTFSSYTSSLLDDLSKIGAATNSEQNQASEETIEPTTELFGVNGNKEITHSSQKTLQPTTSQSILDKPSASPLTIISHATAKPHLSTMKSYTNPLTEGSTATLLHKSYSSNTSPVSSIMTSPSLRGSSAVDLNNTPQRAPIAIFHQSTSYYLLKTRAGSSVTSKTTPPLPKFDLMSSVMEDRPSKTAANPPINPTQTSATLTPDLFPQRPRQSTILSRFYPSTSQPASSTVSITRQRSSVGSNSPSESLNFASSDQKTDLKRDAMGLTTQSTKPKTNLASEFKNLDHKMTPISKDEILTTARLNHSSVEFFNPKWPNGSKTATLDPTIPLLVTTSSANGKHRQISSTIVASKVTLEGYNRFPNLFKNSTPSLSSTLQTMTMANFPKLPTQSPISSPPNVVIDDGIMAKPPSPTSSPVNVRPSAARRSFINRIATSSTTLPPKTPIVVALPNRDAEANSAVSRISQNTDRNAKPKVEVKAKLPPYPDPDREGKYPDIIPRHSAWELGMLLGCSAGLGMVLVVGVRYVYRQACGKRTQVTLHDREQEYSRGERGLIHVQECGDLVRVRRIRENSFVLLAEYDILATPGD